MAFSLDLYFQLTEHTGECKERGIGGGASCVFGQGYHRAVTLHGFGSTL